MAMQENLWDQFYERGYFIQHWPAEAVVRFLMRRAKREGASGRVLDLGCGAGRHVWLAASIGYSTFGVETSEQALKRAKDLLQVYQINADLRTFDGETLPFSDGFFSYIICYGVLDHVRMEQAHKLSEEMWRVLREGGELFLSLRSTRCASPDEVGTKVAKNTYVLTSEAEQGLIQHFFDLDEVCELLRTFAIAEVELYERSTGKGLSYIVDSRWHVVARKSLSE